MCLVRHEKTCFLWELFSCHTAPWIDHFTILMLCLFKNMFQTQNLPKTLVKQWKRHQAVYSQAFGVISLWTFWLHSGCQNKSDFWWIYIVPRLIFDSVKPHEICILQIGSGLKCNYNHICKEASQSGRSVHSNQISKVSNYDIIKSRVTEVQGYKRLVTDAEFISYICDVQTC